MRWVIGAVVALGLLEGCSLDEGGTLHATADGGNGPDATIGDDGGSAQDATLPDGSDDGATNDVVVVPDANDDAPAPDAGPCTTPSSACPFIPAPWKLVVYEGSTALGCPAAWPKTDLATNPSTQAGACACGCKPTPPSCKPAALTVTDGANSSCGGGNTAAFGYGGNCTNATLNLKSYLSVGKVVPIGGICLPGAIADSNKLSFSVTRSCGVPPACAGDVCSNQVPAGFQACVTAPGDLPCVIGGFTTNRYVVGTGANLQCTNGTCTCSTSPSCGGSVDFFSQANCAVKTTTIPADESCQPGNYQNGSTVQSVRYVGAQPNAGCGASGTPTTQAVLDKPQTICCR